ncbi:hypothetical protein PAXRUDRAFT_622438 [Paxillus rubicundulus Ve08.2h10]|uniref:Uncharacterized protein n=1 Tax=Paxillus rubicundulus Ve08.2h10 TaxID=930991 RepID=A0A0D0D4T8_9AGAM|nr:hypothetical protein PAXRUDRAFT_622438 [Paxillus rubicundulus Ve08.2h10]
MPSSNGLMRPVMEVPTRLLRTGSLGAFEETCMSHRSIHHTFHCEESASLGGKTYTRRLINIRTGTTNTSITNSTPSDINASQTWTIVQIRPRLMAVLTNLKQKRTVDSWPFILHFVSSMW